MGLHVTNPARIRHTSEGGIAIRLTNRTGSASVKGLIVELGTADNAVIASAANCIDPIGVMYEDGVATGSECWVVVAGRVQVLLKNGESATRGYWLGCSDNSGRAYCRTNPGDDVEHEREIGHCMESKTSGTNVLVYGILQFN